MNYYTWSAAVDLVKSHLTAFEAKTGIKVNYSNAPWAQYRDTMVTKFVGKAPIDAWLLRFAQCNGIETVPRLLQQRLALSRDLILPIQAFDQLLRCQRDDHAKRDDCQFPSDCIPAVRRFQLQ